VTLFLEETTYLAIWWHSTLEEPVKYVGLGTKGLNCAHSTLEEPVKYVGLETKG